MYSLNDTAAKAENRLCVWRDKKSICVLTGLQVSVNHSSDFSSSWPCFFGDHGFLDFNSRRS